MQFHVDLPDGQKLIVTKAFWTGKTEVRINNGIIGRMGFQRQQTFSIKFKDGSEHTLLVKHPIFDPMPYFFVDGVDLTAAERFDKVRTAILCIPLLLLLQLGVVPAAIACGSVYLNFYIARQKEWTTPLRWSLVGLVPVIGFSFILMMNVLVWGGQTEKKRATHGYHLQTKTPTHAHDPTEDDNNPRLWAKPDPSRRAQMMEAERYTREGR